MSTRRFRKIAVPMLALASLWLGSTHAHAQAEPPVGHDAAVTEFQQARRLIESGNCSAAVQHLEESIAYEPSIGARMSIAECVEKTDPLRAWWSLSEAALLAFTNKDDRITAIEARLEPLERALPMFLVVVPKHELDRPGFELRIDGRAIDRFHLRRPVAVAPGSHDLEAHAPRKTWSKTVPAPAPGTQTRVAVELVDEAPAVTAPAVSTPLVVAVPEVDPAASRRTVGLTIGAVGVIAIGTGVVFGVLAFGKRDELDEACGGSRASCTGSPERVAPIRDNASVLASVSTASFIIGGAALASGVALYLWPSARSTSTKSAARARIIPMLGSMQGLALEDSL